MNNILIFEKKQIKKRQKVQNVRLVAEIIRGTILDEFAALRNESDWSDKNKQSSSHCRESGGS